MITLSLPHPIDRSGLRRVAAAVAIVVSLLAAIATPADQLLPDVLRADVAEAGFWDHVTNVGSAVWSGATTGAAGFGVVTAAAGTGAYFITGSRTASGAAMVASAPVAASFFVGGFLYGTTASLYGSYGGGGISVAYGQRRCCG